MADLNDQQESSLIRLMYQLLDRPVWDSIERTADSTNIKWSDVINLALSVTDWDLITKTLNQVDDEEALLEVRTILKDNNGEGN